MGAVITVSQSQYDMVRGKSSNPQPIVIGSATGGRETAEGDIYIIPLVSNNYYWDGSDRSGDWGNFIFWLGGIDRADTILIDYPLGDLSNDQLDHLWDVSKIFEGGHCIWIDGYYIGDPLVSNGDDYATLFSNGHTYYGNHPKSIELGRIDSLNPALDPRIESSQFGLIDLSQLDLDTINDLSASQFTSTYSTICRFFTAPHFTNE